MEFDPSVISYEQLMRTFFSEAGGGGGKTQYQSAVWPQTEEQSAVAQRLAAEKQSTVPVLKPTEWFDAEEHHQVRPAARRPLPAVPRHATPCHRALPQQPRCRRRTTLPSPGERGRGRGSLSLALRPRVRPERRACGLASDRPNSELVVWVAAT